MNKNLALILTFGCFVGSFAAQAEQSAQCESLASNYQQCDHQLGWYLGGSLGLADTDVDNNRIKQHFEQNNLDVSAVSTDNDDIGGNVFFGYQFNRYFALEAGYLDLGERTVHFSAQTTDTAAFYDAAENIYPQSGDGALVALVASWPISERFKLSAKLGYFDWEGDYVTFDDQGQQGSATASDGDVLLGAELNYRLSEQTQLFASYQRVKLNRDDNDMFGVGLRYYFGDTPQATIKTKPAPKLVVKPPAIAKPVDSDNDGIFDGQDVCPQSQSAYLVDDRGCTVEKEQIVDFALVINYAKNSSEIESQYNDKIIALAEFIKRYQVKSLTVYGHTSATGSKSYNSKLSTQRAQSVAEKLATDYGIDRAIITAIGKGESELKVFGNNEQVHQQNRRIELKVKERLMMPVKR